jgi:8-oxo-dGTP diphosphatase
MEVQKNIMNNSEKRVIDVVAGVIKFNDYFLCVQRNEKGALALKWEFPGGKIESNETHKDALKRELKEELNLNVNIDEHFLTVNHDYSTFTINLHSYLLNVMDQNIQLNEHIDLKWLKKDELLSLDWAEADIPIVYKIIENQ